MIATPKTLEQTLVQALLEKELLYPFALEEYQNTPQEPDAPDCLLEALVLKGFLEAADIDTLTQEHYQLPWVNLNELTSAALEAMPYTEALQHKCFPLYETEDTLALAITHPNALPKLNTKPITPYLASEAAIIQAIQRYYTPSPTTQITFTTETISFEDETPQDIISTAEELITTAYQARASDIHLEPLAKRLRIRFRIDGILQEHPHTLPPEAWAPLLTRIKLMARLDIAQKRLPQDGRIAFANKNAPLDLRVATLPSLHGEALVIRILNKETLNKPLASLGFAPEDEKTFERILTQPDGLCLVTGPTGSGKTTTLYSVLNYLNNPDRKIITIEDPVEYQILGINQVSVKPQVGMTFAAALRAILRQSPDIIMIGEIRDAETARIAIHAALTGHKVFATLHTRCALSALTRLLDMGIPSFLVAAAVRAVLSQRLVRKCCQACQGAQCSSCNHTGFLGRLGLFELLVIDEQLQAHIHNQATPTQLKQIAQAKGLKTLQTDGLNKAAQGLTTKEETLVCY